MVDVPPPEQRLCKEHNKPIQPKVWKSGNRTKGCSKCQHRLQEIRHSKKWDSEFIPCKNHLDRRCKRSAYIKHGRRLCGSCSCRKSDGTIKESHKACNRRKMRKRWKNPQYRENHKWYLRSWRRAKKIQQTKW